MDREKMMTLRRLRAIKHTQASRQFASGISNSNSVAAMSTSTSNNASDGETSGKKFVIGTYNAISSLGLQRFPTSKYSIVKLEDFKAEGPAEEVGPHAILLRSFKLKSELVPKSVRAIARCGAGVNNIEVDKMSKRGIPVFNSPGANANAVKELVICALLLSSRGIIEGVNHLSKMNEEENYDFEKIKKRVEKDKKAFKGQEIYGKKLGVIGLGHIGAAVADAAIGLGMDVVGYDPTIGVEAAWRLPGTILQRAKTLEELVKDVDYVTIHTPYLKETHHLIDDHLLDLMPPHCNIINFARGELVNTKAVKERIDSGKRTGKYIADFADEFLYNDPNTILVPHLGASTSEAESNSAEMAANQVRDFIETGSIRNSVNFPTIELPTPKEGNSRICIVNRNVPGMLGLITTTFGTMGVNIVQHINNSRGDIAYNVVDVEIPFESEKIGAIQKTISDLEGVISSRVILNKVEPNFFLVNDSEV